MTRLPAAIPRHLPVLLLWSGVAAAMLGFATSPIPRELHGGRIAELLLLALAALALAWPLARAARRSLATMLAAIWLLAHLLLAGPMAVLAVLLLAGGAFALGERLLPAGTPGRGALAPLVGLGLIAAVAGWLLPFPLHFRSGYALLLLGAIVWRRRPLLAALHEGAARWREAVAAQPRLAAFAIGALGLASIATWLPTLQFDDLAYHLGLPWQLQTLGYYRMDAASQVWALAPWGSDVLHGIVQLLAGGEARGSLSLLWLLFAAALLWRVGSAIGLDARMRWLAVALFASLPLTAALAGGMQTEAAATVFALGLAALILGSPHAQAASAASLRAAAVLAGSLLLLKASHALLLVPFGLWLLARWRLPWGAVPGAALLGLFVAGSSYAYAWWLTGNPVLPLYNSVFGSPYYPPVDFQDARYAGHLGFDLPWRLVFSSRAHHEGLAGAPGLQLIVLCGALLVALARPQARALALVALAAFALPLLLVQYVRYAYPALVLMLPAMLAGVDLAARWQVLAPVLFGLIALNLAVQPNAEWLLRRGGAKATLLAGGDPDPLTERSAPERLIARALRTAAPEARVLLVGRPFHAEFVGRALALSWYDRDLRARYDTLYADPTPERLAALLDEFTISHVLIGDDAQEDGLRAALPALGAREVQRVGDVSLWTRATAPPPRDSSDERDLARRLWPR